MSHKMSGLAGLTPKSLMGPRETTILEPGFKRPSTSLYVFPTAKMNDFKVTMPSQRDSYLTSPAPSKVPVFEPDKTMSKRPGVTRSVSMLSHRPSPILEEGAFSNSGRKAQTLHSRIPYNRAEKTQIDLNGTAVHLAETENNRHSLPRNSISPSPSTSDISRNASRQSKLTEQPSEVLNRSVSNHFSVSPEVQDLNTSRVDVPETARPVVITPETEQRVNLKSRLAFTENEKSIGQNEETIDFPSSSHAENTVVDTHNVEDVETVENKTNEQVKLFKSLEMNEVNASKEINDVVLMNTPLSYDNSRKGSARSSTSDTADMQLPNGKSYNHDNNLSPITSTPIGSIAPQTSGNNDTTLVNPMQSIELM